MYRITYASEVLASSASNENAIMNPVLDLEINAAGKLTFTMLPGHPMYDRVKIRDRAIIVYLDDLTTPYWAGFVTGIRLDMRGAKDVTAYGFLALFNDYSSGRWTSASWTSSKKPTAWVRYIGETIVGSLGKYDLHYNDDIKLTHKNVPIPEPGEPDLNVDVDHVQMSEVLKSVTDQCGGCVYWDYSVVSGKPQAMLMYKYHTAYELNDGQPVAITYNVIDASVDDDDSDLYTRIIPIGAKNSSGVHYTGEAADDAEGIARYGIIERIVEFKDVTDAAQLHALAQAMMDDVVRGRAKYYEVSFLDLSFSEPVRRIKLMDMVNVRLHDGTTSTMLVTKLTHNLNAPEQDKLTIGADSVTPISAM